MSGLIALLPLIITLSVVYAVYPIAIDLRKIRLALEKGRDRDDAAAGV